MPHRVANFLRTSTHTIENQIAAGFKRQKTSSHSPTHSRTVEPVSHSYPSSISEDAEDPGTMTPDKIESPTEGQHHHHRLSFPGFSHIIRSAKDTHHHHHQNSSSSASLDLKVESPPLVFYGDASASTGALFSGQMCLEVKEDDLPIESFTATLKIHVTQKRPFVPHCHDCTHQYTDIESWTFLAAPLVMTKGTHNFPFSVLLGGHLPATSDGPLVSIAYEFKAEAVPAHGHALKYEKEFEVKRSIPEADVPHHSVRVFPPVDIKADVHYPLVMHPIGSNTMSLRLDGISKINQKSGTVEYWKLKKLSWKLEETAKTRSPACEKHAPKDNLGSESASRPFKKGIDRIDTRVIGEQTLFKGWKSHYSPRDASVEMEISYGITKKAEADSSGKGKKQRRYACDSKCADSTEVTHQLEVEMVVSQEYAPLNKPEMVTQTGVGRIMRMHFNVVLTEPAGLGISWDNETPPLYSMIPASPPAYCSAEAPEDDSDMANIEALVLEAPPTWSPPSIDQDQASGSGSTHQQ